MKYGAGFWCIDPDTGLRLPHRVYPDLRGFEYDDGTGDKAEWLLRDFIMDYIPRGSEWIYRMTINGSRFPTFSTAFDYDGASMPKAFRTAICDKLGYEIRVPSLGHDIGYCVHEVLPEMGRMWWDEFISQTMEAYDATAAQRTAVYAAVRVAGEFWWNKSDSDLMRYRKLFSVVKLKS
jgi:hypothetical protein